MKCHKLTLIQPCIDSDISVGILLLNNYFKNSRRHWELNPQRLHFPSHYESSNPIHLLGAFIKSVHNAPERRGRSGFDSHW